ncbi:IS110 family transposase [Archangium sp.]|uniref:IS110 family transposase n=1 Tax=Archangium sp. TaxID=1872627 RepID=UPI002D23F9AA|nr:IS110 family transposase [Archangium sp.]HYO54955.1 IS110 family transposase [Archangium sp.]
MEYIGIDVHKRDSQVCILGEGGEVVLEQRVRTQRERLGELLSKRPKARVLLEASTESEWVARYLEGLGHEVVVADPNFAPMYATRSRRVKTDKREARTLAEACKLGAYRPAHRTSDAKRHMRAQLAVRESLVRTRTRYIALVSALVRREGLRIADGGAESFVERVAALVLPGRLMAEVAPLLSLMRHLNEQIAFLDGVLERLAHKDEQVARLCTVPYVGPVTACAFVSAVDDPKRFSGPHQVEAYLGLVPSERSSGEKQHKGPITKTGNSRVRWLLVQVALCLLRMRKPETAHLREWAEKIAVRRGKETAVVALARGVAGILFAMLRDGTEYQPPKAQEEEAAA